MTKRESRIMRSFQFKMVTQLERGEFVSVNLKNDLFVKWLVGYMADNLYPFRMIPLGGGVTRITSETSICPLCGGKGYMGENPHKPCTARVA